MKITEKMKRKLAMLILPAALSVGTGCGDTYNYYGTEGGMPGSTSSSGKGSSDRCGNSPVYDTHLWNVRDCESGFVMNSNCIIDAIDKKGNYYPEVGVYRGLDLAPNVNNISIILDPNKRYNPAGGIDRNGDEFDFPPGSKLYNYYQALNDLLDQHQGYVEVIDGVFDLYSEAFISMPDKYPGSEICREIIGIYPKDF